MFAVFPRPLDPQIAVTLERVKQPDFGDVPRHSADENFATVDGVPIYPRRQDAAPSAGGLANGGRVAIQTRRSFDGKRIVRGSPKQLVRT